MHWYWFQMFTIRSTFSSPVSAVQPLSRSPQNFRSPSRALSKAAGEPNFSIMAWAFALLMTPGETNFASWGFSI